MSESATATPVGDPSGATEQPGPATDAQKENNMTMQASESSQDDSADSGGDIEQDVSGDDEGSEQPEEAANTPAAPPAQPAAPATPVAPKADAAPAMSVAVPTVPQAPAPRRLAGMRPMMSLAPAAAPAPQPVVAPAPPAPQPVVAAPAPKLVAAAPPAPQPVMDTTPKVIITKPPAPQPAVAAQPVVLVAASEPSLNDKITLWLSNGTYDAEIVARSEAHEDTKNVLLDRIEKHKIAKLALSKPAAIFYAKYIRPSAAMTAVSPPTKAADAPAPSIQIGDKDVLVGDATALAIENELTRDQPPETRSSRSETPSRFRGTPSSTGRGTPPEEVARRMAAGKKDVRDDGRARPQPSRFDDSIHGDNVEDIDRKKPPVPRVVAPVPTNTAAAIQAAGLGKKKPWISVKTGLMLFVMLVMGGALCYLLFFKDKGQQNAPVASGTSPAGSVAPTTNATSSSRVCEPISPALAVKYFGESDPANYTLHPDITEPHLQCKGGLGKAKPNGKYDLSRCKVCVLPK